MATSIFYMSLALIFYTFLGYPLLLFILSLFIRREVIRNDIRPEVTVIIPVHNEEHSIGAKIKNCLGFDYPREKLKIIIASDGSTDKTEEIVNRFESEQVQFLSLPQRGGKVVAQNHAVQICDTEIIIFTDVAILTRPDCVRLVVQNFAGKEIGCVSCRDIIIDEKSEGEGSYIRYDMTVRKYASQIASITGVTGGFYAVRKEIAEHGWNPAFPPDFYVAIKCIRQGLRVVEDARVCAHYKATARGRDELQRKVRTINRGMHALFSSPNRDLLNPFKYGFVSIQLISHKLLRWSVPFFLISLFLSNLMILDESVLTAFFFLIQLSLYLSALLAFLSKKKINSSLLKFVLYFAVANLAILKAWYEVAIGKEYVIWQPTKR